MVQFIVVSLCQNYTVEVIRGVGGGGWAGWGGEGQGWYRMVVVLYPPRWNGWL